MATVQTFCSSSTYSVAMNLRPAKAPTSAAIPISSPATSPIGNVQLYPNPTTDMATVRFSGLRAGTVSAYVTDMLGRRVLTIAQDEAVEAGEHHRAFSTAALVPGLYYCILEIGRASCRERV